MDRLVTGFACAMLGCSLWAQGGFDGPGRYEITNLKSGKVIDLDRNDQTTVIQFSSRGTDNQAWEFRPAGNGFFYIRNAMNGFALDAGDAGNSMQVRGVPFNGNDSQQWRLDRGKDGNALIVSRFGRTLDIPDGSNRDGVHVQVYDLNGDSNQRFMLRRINGGRRYDWDRDVDRDRGATITCSSNHGERVYCDADTRGRDVQMVRQISGSPCRQGETWGWDRRGIWVDRGCRAEFTLVRGR
ncbi:MAG TPA: RICIN domain-containing protein [Bryobacteraceae bacterium]|nr:RICIN domain-containing protein [Bryobacteraceae bacterium]